MEKKTFKNRLFEFLKNYYNYILFVVIAFVTIYIIRNEVDFIEFKEVILNSNYWFLVIALITLFLYWFMEAWMLKILIRFEYPDESFSHSFSLMMIGQYYNQVTPSSSGGQPLQLIDMVSKGITPGFATAVLVQKYALYQLSVTIIGIIGTLSNIPIILSWPPIGRLLLYIGIGINLAGSFLIIIVALQPRVARIILTFFANIGLKLHIIKNQEKWYGKIDNFVNEYTLAIKALKNRIPQTIFLLTFNILAIIVYYSITYFIYRSLGLSSYSVWRIVLIQSVLYLMIAFVPLPGAAGGAELGFAIVFGAIFGLAESSVALITWRVITFYFILAFGGVYIAIRSIFHKNEKKLTKVKNKDEKD